MYLFINENQIEEYNGEPLKRYIGNKLVKVIANPTDKHLAEFGYKYLDETAEVPEEREGYYIETYYEDGEMIKKLYREIEVPNEEIIEEEIGESTSQEV